MRQQLINRFYKFLRGIGIIETSNGNINNFCNKALKIANGKGQNYVSVRVTKDTHRGYEFSSYYHTAAYCTGHTEIESLQKLSQFGKTQKISPVENVML